MVNAIVQYFLPANGVGKLNHYKNVKGIPKWGMRSSSYFKRYAEKVGADYYFFTEPYVNATSNYFEICRIYLDEMLDQYDKVLYVDLDVMPKSDNSIFEIPVVDVAGWPEYKHPKIKGNPQWKRDPSLISRFRHFGSDLVDAKTIQNIRMINTGVLLWSKEARLKARENFDSYEEWFHYKNKLLDSSLGDVGHSTHCLDQPFLNAMFNKYKFDVLELGYEWNRFPTYNENEPCNFAHYLGKDGKNVILDIFPEL